MVGLAGPGVPGWVDLGTPDIEASKRFYGDLFGWTAETSPDPQYAGYTLLQKDGKSVAGIGPLMMEGQPIVWSSYVIVDDAEQTAARVASAGGQVLVAPMTVGDQGRMAVFLDPTGAAIGSWEPDLMTGAELFNQPGSLCWNELATRDTDGAKPFYHAVFGWEADDQPYGDGTYTQWQLDGRSIGGMLPMGAAFPDEVPPNWGVYFAVDDCDAAVDTVTAGGGSVTMPVMDSPQGRFAGVADPHGAPFFVIAMPH